MGAKFMLKNKEATYGALNREEKKKKNLGRLRRCKRTRDGGSFILAIQHI